VSSLGDDDQSGCHVPAWSRILLVRTNKTVVKRERERERDEDKNEDKDEDARVKKMRLWEAKLNLHIILVN